MRTQSPKLEMIDSLFKRVSETEDEGIIRWAFLFRSCLIELYGVMYYFNEGRGILGGLTTSIACWK